MLSNSCTIFGCPARTAAHSGFLPSQSRISRERLSASMSSLHLLRSPPAAATCSAVSPSCAWSRGSAPHLSRNFSGASQHSILQAKPSTLLSPMLIAFTSAPALISTS
eukprot:9561-Heterococcus_DN1.PRE.1